MGAAIPILSLGLSAVTSFAQIGMANRAYNDQKEAQHQLALETYKEVDRQQGEVHRIANEQVSDRIRLANVELGQVRTMALERGVSDSTLTTFARAVGYLEGADISRINANRKANIEAGESVKRSAYHGYINQVTIASNQRNVTVLGAVTNLIGSGLQIAANMSQSGAARAMAGNPRMT